MKNPRNKANILEFITTSLCDNQQLIPEDVTFFLGGTARESGRTLVINNASTSTLEELSCSARIMAHLCYSVTAWLYKIVHATDTDIIMLCIYYCRLGSLQELSVSVQMKPDKYRPVQQLVNSLSSKYRKYQQELTSALLCAYVLSGCDIVSYPFRRGKKNAAAVAI